MGTGTVTLPTDGTLQELELSFTAEADGSALEITNLALIENEL